MDLGIALCHFEIAAEEREIKGHFTQEDPGIQTPDSTEYVATYVLEA